MCPFPSSNRFRQFPFSTDAGRGAHECAAGSVRGLERPGCVSAEASFQNVPTADGMPHPLQRAALYYPYIHIRSEHWLKATLLCAPVVKRIVPDGYVPEDQANIRKYAGI